MKEWLKSLFAFSIVLIVHVTGDPVITLLEEPSSLLIPANEIGTFSCQALCVTHQCTGHWLINNSYSHTSHVYEPKVELLMKGFMFPANENSGDEYTLKLVVNASESVNNTDIRCEFDVSGSSETAQSMPATLLVISKSPLPLNPTVENNSTHITLKWSPPFLWPGHPILHFNLSIVDWSDGSPSHQIVNSTFSERIVVFNFEVNNSWIPENLTCTEITFSISAVGVHDSRPLKAINLTEWILPPLSSLVEFISATIQTNVLFSVDATPALVEVKMELPEIFCIDEKLNYTFFIENKDGEAVAVLGPIQRRFRSGTIKQLILLGALDRNQIYFLGVQINTKLLELLSHKHPFNTTYMIETSLNHVTFTCTTEVSLLERDEILLSYKAGMGISLAFAAMLMFLVLVSLYFNCKRKRNADRRMRGLSNLICKNMVDNPIYEENKNDPMYESVQPQLRIQIENVVPHPLPASCRQQTRDRLTNDSSNRVPGSAGTDNDIPAVVDVNTVRYVDHPMRLSHVARKQSLGIEIPFSNTDHCCNNTGAHSRLGLNKMLAGSGSNQKDVEKNDSSISHQVNQTTLAIKIGKNALEDINKLGSRELSAAVNVAEVEENNITMN